MRAVLTLLAFATAAQATESRVFVHEIPDEATFRIYSRQLGADRYGKFVIDVASGEIFFFDANLYRLHADFVFAHFYGRPMTNEDIPEYNLNYEADKPRFILGYLTQHLKVGLTTFSFWEGDAIRAADIRKVRDKLRATFFAKDILFRPDSPEQEKKLKELGDIPTITNDKIYKLSPYQAFNDGEAVGRLRIVPAGTAPEKLLFDRDDVVVLQESYPDIVPVAGILTTIFCTPLSHVNLRAKEWNIPNAGLKDAVARFGALDGKIVLYRVEDLSATLREATPKEIQTWADRKKEARIVHIPPLDLGVTELRPLDRMHDKDAGIYGTKAANLGEIASAHVVPVPAGFGVPVAFYRRHLERNGIDKDIDKFLTDPRFDKDTAWRKARADAIRTRIEKAPIDAKLVDAVWAKVQKDLGGKGVFVRSSTNAEDLEGFNGAGLYETMPNVTSKKQLADALRIVWGSLWNFRGVESRSLAGIDHRACGVGVLVQVGVNASAAGVLVTRNILDPDDDRSFTINAKRGLGLRVVGGTTVPEMIIYDPGNYGTKIVSRSDDPTMLVFDGKGGVKEVPNTNRGVILTEARAKALADTVERFRPLFPNRYALDVEWVFEGDKVWIVQSRPYVAR
jgi:hypothetical protein